jgi:outer membrane protein assembly factor BamB
MRNVLFALVVWITGLLGAKGSAFETGWPQFRGSDRDGHAQGIPSVPFVAKPMWRFPLPSQGVGGIAANDEMVVVSSRDANEKMDLFFVLDTQTGALICKHAVAAEGHLDYGNSTRATAVIGDEFVVLQNAFGTLLALDPLEDRVLWTKNFELDFQGERPTWGYSSSPLLMEHGAMRSLVVQPGGVAHSVVALNPIDGQVRWSVGDQPAAYASPIFIGDDDQSMVVTTGKKGFCGWRANDGTRLWQIQPEIDGDFMVPSPIYHRSHLFMTSENNGARAYTMDRSGSQPMLKATSSRLSGDTHSPVCIGDFIIGVDGDLVALQISNALQEASSISDGSFSQYSALIAEGDRILVCCDDGRLLGVRIQDGTLEVFSRTMTKQSESPIMAHPALVDGLLLIRQSDAVQAYQLTPTN